MATIWYVLTESLSVGARGIRRCDLPFEECRGILGVYEWERIDMGPPLAEDEEHYRFRNERRKRVVLVEVTGAESLQLEPRRIGFRTDARPNTSCYKIDLSRDECETLLRSRDM